MHGVDGTLHIVADNSAALLRRNNDSMTRQ